MSRMQIQDGGTIFAGQAGTSRAICCFPHVCQLGNGELLTTFQCGPAKNHMHGAALLARSTDGGTSWSAPTEPFGPWAQGQGLTVHVAYLSEVQPDRLVANLMLCDHRGDPTLPFFNPDTGGVLPVTIGLSESTDDGHTWSNFRVLHTERFDDVPVPIMSPIHVTPQGRWLLPFETSKRYDDPSRWYHHAAMITSDDQGCTWGSAQSIAHDPSGSVLYWDHRLAVTDNGQCVDFLWTYDADSTQDRTVHRTVSLDGGRQWSPPEDTGLIGQSAWPVPLDGRQVVVLTVDRYHRKVIKACLSDDLGQTWVEEQVLYQHEKTPRAKASMNQELVEMGLWSFGLPCGVRTGVNDILATWYQGDSASTNISWARLGV